MVNKIIETLISAKMKQFKNKAMSFITKDSIGFSHGI